MHMKGMRRLVLAADYIIIVVLSDNEYIIVKVHMH